MGVLFYSFTICVVAAVLYVTVNEFEPNRPYANLLKLLILTLAAAATARRLLP